MAQDFLSKKEHDDKCDKLWKHYEEAHREVVGGLDDVKSAIQHRNNVDAEQAGYLRGMKEAKDASIRTIQNWLKIVIAVITILTGLGVFTTIQNKSVIDNNDIEIKQVLEALKELTEIKK